MTTFGLLLIKRVNFYFIYVNFILFICDLAALGLSCGTWDLVP